MNWERLIKSVGGALLIVGLAFGLALAMFEYPGLGAYLAVAIGVGAMAWTLYHI